MSGFRLSDTGLSPLMDADRPLSAENAEAAQIGFTPDGSMIVITERATDSIITFAIDSASRLGEMQVTPSAGPTPYGFAFTSGVTLVVTEAFRAGEGRRRRLVLCRPRRELDNGDAVGGQRTERDLLGGRDQG